MCPGCGTEFAIADKEKTVVATIVGKDSGPGTVYPAVAGQDASSSGKTKVPKTAKERIEALRAAGVDVSHLFAMQGANGGECIASNKDGLLTMLDDDDPISDKSSIRAMSRTAACSVAGSWRRCSI